jgi:hypothetical protein
LLLLRGGGCSEVVVCGEVEEKAVVEEDGGNGVQSGGAASLSLHAYTPPARARATGADTSAPPRLDGPQCLFELGALCLFFGKKHSQHVLCQKLDFIL